MSDTPPRLDPIPRPPGTPAEVPAPSDPLRRELAAAAAQWVADGGLDYGSAKRKAVRERFGDKGPPRGAMPDNVEIDEALREHLALFDDDHPARVERMRRAALALMDALDDFRPHLTGAVWKGIVAEHAPIHLQLFHDDVKDVEIRLLNDGLDFEVGEMPHFRGDGRRDDVEALMLTWRGEPVVLSLYPADDLRGALRGVPAERGDAGAVRRMLGLDGARP
ncbi:MAG TPA: hypothetical protein VEA81_04090 [Burkholderiaceae bacterium]|nr:hypothetical protein [Burkholderiaceae bacterium]